MVDRVRARRQPRVAGPSTRGMRWCIGCRERFPREALIRLVCDPGGAIVVDRHLKAPGRGAHLCYDTSCIEQACRRRAFGRAFKRSVAPIDAETLRGSALAAVEARITDGLAIGRRAGWTRSGMDVLERQRARLRALVVATDASPATAQRLAGWGDPETCPLFEFGDRHRLGATQGQMQRVAVGISDPGLAERLRLEFTRRDQLLVAA